ncbi:MAG: hypothetical protein ACYCW6_07820 [Candidatus Xenobia bacterium]
MKFYVWGIGESHYDMLRRGRPSEPAHRAASQASREPGRPFWDPREHSSWAVEVEVPGVPAVENMARTDPAVKGWLSAALEEGS